MSRKSAFSIEGQIVATLENSVFVVGLSNGHQMLGHLSRGQRPLAKQVKVGQNVTILLSPCDLSQGRVILKEDKL